VAMHVDALLPGTDPTLPGAHRFPGPALIVASRLLDCKPLRHALIEAASHDGCELAVIVSQPVYEKVVKAGLRGIRPGLYRPIRVHIPEKGFDQTAYLYVPGCDVNRFTLDAPTPGPAPPPAPPREPGRGAKPDGDSRTPAITQTFWVGDVHGGGTFGSIGNLSFGHPASDT
jgi:hypothetical protein